MPLRTYRCRRCRAEGRVLQGWALEAPLCPCCGQAMGLVLGAPGVRFGRTWVQHSLFDEEDRGHGGDLGLYGG